MGLPVDNGDLLIRSHWRRVPDPRTPPIRRRLFAPAIGGIHHRRRPAADTGVDDDLPQVLADTVTDFLAGEARGWIHSARRLRQTWPGALVSAAWIFSSSEAVLAASIYTATIVAMFSFSALYHRVHWQSPTTLKWMKRIDPR